MAPLLKEKIFILDVDGVMTSGEFIYSKDGKAYKIFGPDDHDALNILRKYIEIIFITGDKAGYSITKKRIKDHMKYPLEFVSTSARLDWISKRYALNNVIYMCDGIFDFHVAKKIFYSIAPLNADDDLKKVVSFITNHKGGDRAVSEACKHIYKKFISLNNTLDGFFEGVIS
jgi:3-deoxy-D-manno-octulosonate 8-phosphate phosphatase (KDO 8-P phosphatase)